jgi:tryptophan halogenase
MSVPREPLRSIVVVGDGQLGALAALGLKKALPTASVTVVATPVDPANMADRAPSALPFTNQLHDKLGIDEEGILRRAGGSHRLITRFIGWGAAPAGSDQVQHGALTYGMTNDPSLKARFAKEWGGGSRSGTERGPLGEEFAGSLAEVLVHQRRFGIPPAGTPTPLAEVDYCLRWNPYAYRQLIIEAATKAGVEYLAAPILGAEPDGQGGLARIKVDGHPVLEADLFLDCSGPAAILRASLDEPEAEDWSDYLPIRKLAYAKPNQPIIELEDRVSLLEPAGWASEFAGRNALQAMLALPAEVGDAQIEAMLGAVPSELIMISPGARTKPWMGNVIALGDAAAHFEPLGFLNLDLAHRQLDLLIEMLPGRKINPRERNEYNRRSAQMMHAVRDVLGMHYAAPTATQRFGALKQSPALKRLLDQYSRQGRIPFAEESPLVSQELIALLTALGIESAQTPLARESSEVSAETALGEFNAKARSALETVPPYQDWLRSILESDLS